MTYKSAVGRDTRLIDPFLELTATGIKRLESTEEAEQLLSYWLSNPAGSLWGRPEWGHPFESKKFMSNSSSDELKVLEMMAVRKLRRDIPQIRISGILGSFSEDDLLNLTIIYEKGGELARYSDGVSFD